MSGGLDPPLDCCTTKFSCVVGNLNPSIHLPVSQNSILNSGDWRLYSVLLKNCPTCYMLALMPALSSGLKVQKLLLTRTACSSITCGRRTAIRFTI